MTRVHRRQVLKALGLGGAASLFPSLAPRAARAQVRPPQRLVLFYTQHGPPASAWRMTRGNPDSASFEYALGPLDRAEFSAALAPLYDRRDDLVVIDGLSQLTHMEDERLIGRARHDAAPAVVWTGAGWLPGHLGGDRSVDQLVAAEIARPDRFRSLEYTTWSPTRSAMWQGPGVRLEAERSASRAFDRLFAAAVPSTPTEASRVRDARGAILDFVRREYDLARARAGASDRARLEQHRDLLGDLSSRVASLSSVSCGTPARPAGTAMQQLMRLTTAALACDLTRVVSLQSAPLDPAEFGAPPGDVHQDYAHMGGDPAKIMWMGRYYAAHATELAFLLGELDAIVEADGSTLLDNTVVCWLSELATGNHETWNIPAVVAGGALRKGRYVHYGRDRRNPLDDRHGLIGRGHNELLVTIAQAVGASITAVGKRSVMSLDGSPIRLDRPLAELL